MSLKKNLMGNIFKTLLIGLSFIANTSCAQTLKMKTASDAKKLELNKKEFIGKRLSFLLERIDLPIKSVIPVPNKNLKQINRLSILFVDQETYKNAKGELPEKPTRIAVTFNQNWDLLGERCAYDKPDCTKWTKEDEKNLGDLIVYDIYVLGKD